MVYQNELTGLLTVSEVKVLARALGGGVGARGAVAEFSGAGLARIAIG